MRRVVWILIGLAIILGTGVTNATPVEEELGSRASISPYMVAQTGDGSRFWAYGSIRRGFALGSSSYFCVGAQRRHTDRDAPRQRRVILHEETCQMPQNVTADPISWAASVGGSLPTELRISTWEWDERQLSWVLVGEEVRAGLATFNLRWIGTEGQASPIVYGVPVCITYSLLMPAYPCPSTHIGAGVNRSARWEGSLEFQGLGASFNSNANDLGGSDVYRTSLGIWWGT